MHLLPVTPAHKIPNDLQLLLEQSFLHLELLVPGGFFLIFLLELRMISVSGILWLVRLSSKTGEAIQVVQSPRARLVLLHLALLEPEHLHNLQ